MTSEWITSRIYDFVNNSPLNRVESIGLNRIFDEPLIGIAAANDTLFDKLKEPGVVGTNHLMPAEWLPGAKSVISYFLPFSLEIRKANYGSGLPAKEWLYGRIEGEAFNNALRKHIVDDIIDLGADTGSPALDSRFAVADRRSNWSERHAAFVAGLGTFGLSKSFITAKGSAGRFGSVITALELEPTPRGYSDIYEYCTWCGECISRCPSGAIDEGEKNVTVCGDYLDSDIKPRFAPRYGCGKCQTNVPCEYRMPK